MLKSLDVLQGVEHFVNPQLILGELLLTVARPKIVGLIVYLWVVLYLLFVKFIGSSNIKDMIVIKRGSLSINPFGGIFLVQGKIRHDIVPLQ